mgnify:CR=1 FL=1
MNKQSRPKGRSYSLATSIVLAMDGQAQLACEACEPAEGPHMQEACGGKPEGRADEQAIAD